MKTFMRILAGLIFTTAAATANADVVVASKNDTEGSLLAHIILQVLQANNIAATDRTELGSGPIVRKALLQDEIDIYPEYTGNGAFFFGKESDTIWRDPVKGYETAKELDYQQNKIVWLTPSSANNTWAIGLRKDVADANHIKTLTDFAKYVNEGGAVVLAASTVFVNSPGALPAFKKAYGFDLKADQLLVLAGGDTAATISAAANNTSGANTAMVYGTDGGIAASGLIVLEDDKNVQFVYQPTPIIREQVLKQYPQIDSLLKPIFEKLDVATLRELNKRVQVDGEPAKAVAADFLHQAKLVQ